MSSPSVSEPKDPPKYSTFEWKVSPPKKKRPPLFSLDDNEGVVKADSPTSVVPNVESFSGQERGSIRRDEPCPKGGEAIKKPNFSGNSSDIFRPMGSPGLSSSSTSTGRRSRQYFSSLPTLDETSSSESGSSSFDDEEAPAPAAISSIGTPSTPTSSPRKAKKDRVGPLVSAESMKVQQRKFASSSTRKPAVSKTPQERVKELEEKGKDLADRGEEEKALLVYKKALKLNRNETARIKTQLRQVDGKHPSTVESIASRLHEDWLYVGRSIYNVRCSMAVLCERVGDYEKAIACCEEAEGVCRRQLSFMQKNKSKDDIDEARKKVRDMKSMMEKMKVAQESFEDRKTLHEGIIGLRRALVVTADPIEKRHLYGAIEEQLKIAFRLESDVLGKDHPQVADSLSLWATIDMEKGDTEKALDHMTSALAIAKEALGMKHPLTGEMLLQVARIYATQTPVDESNAVAYYEKAVTVFRASERNQRLLGAILNEISVIRIRQRKYADAIKLLTDALDFLESDSNDKKEGEINTDAVQLWRNLGECHSAQKDYQKASEALVTALDLQREARKAYEAAMSEFLADNPPPPAYLVDDESVADTLRRLAKSYVGCSKHEEALTVFVEALMIHRGLVVKAVNPVAGRPNERLSEHQDQLAHTLFCIAELRETTGELDEALRVYGESMQLRLFSDAHRQEGRRNMVHCAMCLRGIGNVHLRKKEYEAAKKVFEDALSYCEGHGVPDNHVIVKAIQKRLDEAKKRLDQTTVEKEILQLEQQVKSEIDHGDLDKSVETLTKLMASRKTLLKILKSLDDDSSTAKMSTAYTLKIFGQVLTEKGDLANAERAFGDALKLFKKAGDACGDKELDDIESRLKRLRQLRA